LRRIDRLDLILEDDLLNRMTQFLRYQPTRVCFCPVSFAGKVPAMAKEKRQQLLPLDLQIDQWLSLDHGQDPLPPRAQRLAPRSR
jgi:hypothetical protein